jgi:hypothetical protein
MSRKRGPSRFASRADPQVVASPVGAAEVDHSVQAAANVGDA